MVDLLLVVVVVRAVVVVEVLQALVAMILVLAVSGSKTLFVVLSSLSPLDPVDVALGHFLISIVICFLLLLLLSPGHESGGERVVSMVPPSLHERINVVDVTTSSDRSTRFRLLLLRVVIRFALNWTDMITFLFQQSTTFQ